MALYTGFDLHSNNNYLGIVDHEGKRIFRRKLLNHPEQILEALNPFQRDIVGIVVESTYNWYWLVDMLMENQYRVHLANPSAITQYKGLKHSDDSDDAFWLADMLRLNILPEGYIYPKQERPVRDLLRKRSQMVQIRTSLILSLQNIIVRNFGHRINVNDVKCIKENRVLPFFSENEDLALSGKTSKETIDFLTRQIREIESVVEKKIKLKDNYKCLLTIPGVGKVLGLTIMLESGPISRFADAGNYSSYCRKVKSAWFSNGKQKGKGNKKNGNKYLCWAFSEAAELGRRFDETMRSYFNRKSQKTNRMVAHGALSHKLSKAAYYIMRDGVPFDPARLFS
jgi:transposase